MKRLFFITLLCCACGLHGQHREWYAAPTSSGGSPSGLGTYDSPWDLQTAFNNPSGQIQPGDTLWLRHGTYRGRYECKVAFAGTSTNNIVVSSYPGEWAILDGNINEDLTPEEEEIDPISPCTDPTTQRDGNPEDLNGLISPPDPLTSFTDDEDEEESATCILRILGSHVTFRNFEVGCLGHLYRVRNDVTPNGTFDGVSGIVHDVKTNLQNLVVRNVPGVAIGSWKNASDSELYGNLIYNNGYIRIHQSTESPFPILVEGREPGIYTQNNHTSLMRSIRNNFIFNNYNSGIMVWSTTENPVSHYLRNYNISENVVFNNGNPGRRHILDDVDPDDSKPNMLIDSWSTHATNNRASNVNVFNNVFYLNNGGAYISGLRVGNSNDVNIYDNNIYKGTSAIAFLGNNNNIEFHNNTYLGKRIQVWTIPADYASDSWSMHDNNYHPWRFQAFGAMVQIPNAATPATDDDVRINLATFQGNVSPYNYNAESGSTKNKCWEATVAGKTVFYSMNAGDGDTPNPLPQRNHVLQNEFNPNVFYVTIYNPRPDCPSGIGCGTFNTANMQVDFTAYGIPTNTYYTVKDAQNYFGGTLSATTLASNKKIGFDLYEDTVELPNGFFDWCPDHTYAELGTYIVEFGCQNMDYDHTYTGTENSAFNRRSRYRLHYGTPVTSYSSGTTANIDARAEDEILIRNSTLKGLFLAKIEDTCYDIPFVSMSRPANPKNPKDKQEVTEVMKETELINIYPNPGIDIFNVMAFDDFTINHIIVTDLLGRTVFDSGFGNVKNAEVDISNQADGIYNLQVFMNDGGKQTKKIIKNK